jgi:uncharacterized protein (TIGR00251 family)
MKDTVIELKVITKASRNLIKADKGCYKVYLNCAPVKGKANKVLMDLLASYFKVNKSDIKIQKGEYSHRKTVAIKHQTPR